MSVDAFGIDAKFQEMGQRKLLYSAQIVSLTRFYQMAVSANMVLGATAATKEALGERIL
ncbi:hypothetical protein [Bradyrhizobium sp. CCBAU 51765]|uniref:hypothetical protein n=1 Tax=Bradyrhizobium sp. CCBAU 51765 TaxID=1325102 RepID=UPI001FEF5873|nr:hypothetical protein [Bradyrhizobium sp. CCBAU 51765]